MRDIVVHQLSPNGGHRRQVKVRVVHILVHGERDVASAGQERAVLALARDAHA